MPSLNEFPVGETLFLDANIFLGHLVTGDASCTGFFQRLRAGEIRAVTSVAVLAEVRHRLLLIEAVRQGLIANAKRALEGVRARPEILSRLSVCDSVLNDLLEIPLRVTSLTPAQFRAAQRLSLRYHLLTNDALHVANLRAHRLRHLASTDRDFRRVPRLTLWVP